MPDNARVKEITAKLEQGVIDIFSSEKYADYLKTMSRFHSYSTRNTLLIHTQRPDATLVAGFQSWQTKFSRHVKKGEKAIKILAPVLLVMREEKEKLDPVTRLPVLGEDGMPIVEHTERQLARFKVTNVFDVKQTDGKPLPTLVQDLTGNVEQYEAFMDALRAVSPLPIVMEQMPDDADGACYYGDRIAIREGMSEIQTVSAVIHEITHAKLHDIESLRLMDEAATPKDRRTQEVEAESVSYAVCQYFNIETGANSFGYVADWSETRELKELNASLDAIRKAAAELIDGIDGKFQELVKERNITLVVGGEQVSLDELPTEIYDVTEPASDGLAFAEPALESVSANDSINQPADNISALIAQYTHHAEVADPQRVGSNVLMTPVFDNGNFNRTGKKIRVTVEEPIGKYQIYNREAHGDKNLYFLTASGRVDRLSQYFNDEWDSNKNEWVSVRPTEDEIDKAIIAIANIFEQDMADPNKWAMYQHAAVVNRLDECEAHNKPIREQREAERKKLNAEKELTRQEEKQQAIAKFDSRVDEIANAIERGEDISVSYDEHAFEGKNPVLELFKLYDINLPLRTQGWVNTGLAAIKKDGYSYYKGKHKGNSTTFGGYLDKLHSAIILTPIEVKRQQAADISETEKTSENKLYNKFAELFPEFANGEYSYLKLEAGDSFMPLSLEYIFGDRISVMHTYKLNGDLCYDPMMQFRFSNTDNMMAGSSFEQSVPPINQLFDEDGMGVGYDGNGNQYSIPNLQSQLDDFAAIWLDNISEQGYIPVRGIREIDGEDVEVLFDAEGMPIMPEAETPEVSVADTLTPLPATNIQESPKTTELDLSLPDPTVTTADLNDFGYHFSEMLPLSNLRAIELFDTAHPIYLLYPDDTESFVIDRNEIPSHEGYCGIERDDWQLSPVRAAQIAVAMNSEGSRESELLHGSTSMFGIYQIADDIDNARNFRFTPMREMEALGLEVDRSNYKLIYSAPLTSEGTQANLNTIFANLNNDERPADFVGRSLSVSDIIVLQQGGEISSHYVDSVGFMKLDSFLGEERQSTQAAHATSQDKEPVTESNTYSQVGNSTDIHTGPTIAELEADVDAGKSISLHDLAKAVKAERTDSQPRNTPQKGKPTLMERLEDGKRKAAQNGQQQSSTKKEERD